MSRSGEHPSVPNVGVLMFIAGRAMEQEILAGLAAAGYGTTLAQARLAARIGEDGNRLTELAESAQVTKQTAGVLVDQLVAQGFVERVPDPTDARARIVRLAPRGRRAQAAARRIEQQIVDRWREHLGDRGFAQLERQLVKLREITDPYADT